MPFLVVAHPSPDLYGSDLQLVETVAGAREHGWRVTVFLPESGPLVELLTDTGATVEFFDAPVLRKALLNPKGVAVFGAKSVRAIAALVRRLRHDRPDVVYVNTITIPAWTVAARAARVPVLTHVHEAESAQRRAVQLALSSPLLISNAIVVNSLAARESLESAFGRLQSRISVIYNGVPGPPHEPSAPRRRTEDEPARIAVVGRLSPRKGIDVAVSAVSRLRREGRDVRLVVCGSTFPGYEWYEDELRSAGAGEAPGAIEFRGYVHPTWDELAAADVVLVPSRSEPFGNAAVEALLARRPLVASDVQGLREVVRDGTTGVLVPPDDATALAEAVATLLDDSPRAAALADAGRQDAVTRFSPPRYRAEIVAQLDRLRPDHDRS